MILIRLFPPLSFSSSFSLSSLSAPPFLLLPPSRYACPYAGANLDRGAPEKGESGGRSPQNVFEFWLLDSLKPQAESVTTWLQ